MVMVTGPRQCGKTTLVRDLVAGNREFITMDDDTVLAVDPSQPYPFDHAWNSVCGLDARCRDTRNAYC
ncbi:MAG: hypothetical protein NVS9B4_27420 [Candidatus Acidiferrum sp.]